LILFTLYSPRGTHDAEFLANYAYINLADRIARDSGVGQVIIFGAGEYAMRMWVKPDQLAKLGLTVNDLTEAIRSQNTVNPVGQIGAEPAPDGQEFTYSVRTHGRRVSAKEFGNIIVRTNSDGSMVRLRDVGRVELGANRYNISTRFNGKSAAVIAVYQLPGSNALATVNRLRALMDEMKVRFPEDLNYTVSLDTTLAV
ncbi:MAG: hydrophobe/amphiphile efflux-1 family RND transporter, partial [Deltaproteobacteria bacterium]|nr:hydrophobe/amphiphile efflux-1 family RND transporter [Deltaproteobacteria bacterium]